jgi:hypothetical protein
VDVALRLLSTRHDLVSIPQVSVSVYQYQSISICLLICKIKHSIFSLICQVNTRE